MKSDSKWKILRDFALNCSEFLKTSLSDFVQKAVFYCCHFHNVLLEIYLQKYTGAMGRNLDHLSPLLFLAG